MAAGGLEARPLSVVALRRLSPRTTAKVSVRVDGEAAAQLRCGATRRLGEAATATFQYVIGGQLTGVRVRAAAAAGGGGEGGEGGAGRTAGNGTVWVGLGQWLASAGGRRRVSGRSGVSVRAEAGSSAGVSVDVSVTRRLGGGAAVRCARGLCVGVCLFVRARFYKFCACDFCCVCALLCGCVRVCALVVRVWVCAARACAV